LSQHSGIWYFNQKYPIIQDIPGQVVMVLKPKHTVDDFNTTQTKIQNAK